jgi:phosphoglycerate dehydrogenase-like enzyme
LVVAEVVAEGDLECGRMMGSSCCYYYQWNHSGEEKWKDEEHEVAGKEYVIPSTGMVGKVVFDHLQAFGVVREDGRCLEDWRNNVADLLQSLPQSRS